MPRVTNAQMYEYINTNKYIADFVKGKMTKDGKPLNAIGAINQIQSFISTLPNAKKTENLINSLNSIKEVVKFLDSANNSRMREANLSWMGYYKDQLKRFGEAVTSFYNANGYSLAEKDEMIALKGITQFVDFSLSNMDQLTRSRVLDEIDSKNRTLKSNTEKFESRSIEFINLCKGYDKKFKEGELDYTDLEYHEGNIKNTSNYYNDNYVRFISELQKQGIKHEKYLLYGNLCNEKKENQDKINNLNSKYLNDCISAKAIKRYLGEYNSTSALIAQNNQEKEENKKIQSSIQNEIDKLNNEKIEYENKLLLFDQQRMDDSIKAYEVYSVLDSLNKAVSALQDLSNAGISIQALRDTTVRRFKDNNGGLSQKDMNSFSSYNLSVLALNKLIPGIFDNVINQLNNGIITEPADLLETYKDVIKEQITAIENEAQKYERPAPDIMESMDTYKFDKRKIKELSSSIEAKTAQYESITDSINRIDIKNAKGNSILEQLNSDANQVLNNVLGDNENKNLSFTEIQAKMTETIEQDKIDIKQCQSVDEKLNSKLDSLTNVKKELAITTANLFKNLKNSQDALNYVRNAMEIKADIKIDNDLLLEQEKEFQGDISNAKDVNIYSSISDKLQSITKHIHDKTSDPNNAKPGEKGKNSDEFFDMYTKLANTLAEINNPNKEQNEKAQMIIDLAGSAKKYLDVKANQFRPFPSEQRRARIAFAQELVDFKETALDMIKNTDARENKLNELVNPVERSKSIDIVLKGYEEKMHEMHKDAKSTVKEADAHTVQESHIAI